MISIICPVYNSEKYLDKCINSILSQTYKNWELILVNDCSYDNSADILKGWKLKDDRIIVINHKVNQGVDQARFTGIHKAKGRFLMFVDSDDWISSNSLKLMRDKIIQDNADIVHGSYVKVFDQLGIIKSKPRNYFGVHRTESITEPLLFDEYYISYFGSNKLLVSMWGKLYRKEIIDLANLKPTFFKMGEDLIFNMDIHPYVKKISFLTETIYYYRFGGMTTTSNPNFLNNVKKQYYLKKSRIEKYKYYKAEPLIKTELVNCFYSHFYNQKLLDRIETSKIRENIIHELKDTVYKDLTNMEGNYRASLIVNNKIDNILHEILSNYSKNNLKFWTKRMISKLF